MILRTKLINTCSMTSSSRAASALFSSRFSEGEDVLSSFFPGIVSKISFSVWNLTENFKVKCVIFADLIWLKVDDLIWSEILAFESNAKFHEWNMRSSSAWVKKKFADRKWDTEMGFKWGQVISCQLTPGKDFALRVTYQNTDKLRRKESVVIRRHHHDHANRNSKCVQVLSRKLFDHVDCHVKYVCGTNGQFSKNNYHE